MAVGHEGTILVSVLGSGVRGVCSLWVWACLGVRGLRALRGGCLWGMGHGAARLGGRGAVLLGPILVSVNGFGIVRGVVLGGARVVAWRAWQACRCGWSECGTRLSRPCAMATGLLQQGPILVSVRGDMWWQLQGSNGVWRAGWAP